MRGSWERGKEYPKVGGEAYIEVEMRPHALHIHAVGPSRRFQDVHLVDRWRVFCRISDNHRE